MPETYGALGADIIDNDIVYMTADAVVIQRATVHVAELPGITVLCDSILKTTPEVTGGIVDFDVSVGAHVITVKSGNTIIWTKNITVENTDGIYVKGRVLNDVSWADLHIACQNGYAEHMFSLKDVRKVTEYTASLMQGSDNNFFIADFQKNGNSTVIVWMSCNCSASNETINNKFKWASATATSWTEIESSEGGWKYSICRTLFMKVGDEIYTQAQSLKPDGAAITDGTSWSNYKYSDTKARAGFYTFEMVTPGTSTASDTSTSEEKWTKLTEWITPAQAKPIFVKGYFCELGTLTEETFSSGYFYTMASNVYTPATTYNASTTYYGLYEFIHVNGKYYAPLDSINQYLVRREMKQNPGKTRKNCITICNDFVTIPSLGELMGQYIKGNTLVASSYRGPNYYGDAIIANEQFAGCNGEVWYLNQNQWTRSVLAYASTDFCFLSSAGGVTNSGVSYACRLRPSFQTL